MQSNFYLKMALRNIRANKQLYLPYGISATLTVSMLFQMFSLMSNDFDGMRGADILIILFRFGAITIGLFTLVFLLYTNSFLIKKRKKEVGLYGILGLEKRHVARILLLESIIVGMVTILLGLVMGSVLGRLMFLFLNYLLKLPVEMTYSVDPLNFVLTAAVFVAIFFVAYLYNVSQVTFSNPIQLLRGEKEGEKEPKSNVFLFLLGLLLLGAGYYISLTIADPIAALLSFFIAVLLVIVGTYLLFTSGSIYILKRMKKNQKLYYQPRAFISISGMLYRMKQNATGLANIAILSCMVIIALGTTTAIYVGSEQALTSRYPLDHQATVYYDDEKTMEAIQADIDKVTARIQSDTFGLTISDLESYSYANVFGVLDGNEIKGDDGSYTSTTLLTAETINELEGLSLAPEPGEIYIHEAAKYQFDTIRIADEEFSVKTFNDELDHFMVDEELGQTFLFVVPTVATISTILDTYEEKGQSYDTSVTGSILWNTHASDEAGAAYSKKLRPLIEEEAIVNYETQADMREEWYSMTGGFLFLGIFLGTLFTIGTILITYFKQVSEGYEDRTRFQIMQKVGLDKEMIRDTSRSQVIWMFMLPIIVATIHTAFAYPILYKMLLIFGLHSHTILIGSIVGVVVAFGLIYWIIYRLTARIYYSIVQ
ncbi:ABC transporter permease [Jeotgalibaca sp. A127]|uniref:ABC transporter permease n=1 Tax=Jeotgalibaca sp. A127 TaxID=3457324 RepID=UPI003FCF0127